MRGCAVLCVFAALAGLAYAVQRNEVNCKCGAEADGWSMPPYTSGEKPHLLANRTCEPWQVVYVDSFKFYQIDGAESWICLGNMTDMWSPVSFWEWGVSPTNCASWTGALHPQVPKSAYPLGQITLIGNCKNQMQCYGRVLLNVTCLDPREWRTSPWSSCSSSCTRTRTTWCINKHTGVTVSDAECEGWGARPAAQQTCQSGACSSRGNCVCACVNATGADEVELSFDVADCDSGCTQAACQQKWPGHCPSTTTGSVVTQCAPTDPVDPSHPGSAALESQGDSNAGPAPSRGSSTMALPLGLLATLWLSQFVC
eukprot:m51a1_g12073 hypothetical protein (313) ;mRNA; r:6971-7954